MEVPLPHSSSVRGQKGPTPYTVEPLRPGTWTLIRNVLSRQGGVGVVDGTKTSPTKKEGTPEPLLVVPGRTGSNERDGRGKGPKGAESFGNSTSSLPVWTRHASEFRALVVGGLGSRRNPTSTVPAATGQDRRPGKFCHLS